MNIMATTQDVESLTNTIIMQIDATMRKNGVDVYPRMHNDVRPTVRKMVNEIMGQQFAELAVEESRLEPSRLVSNG